MSPKTLIAAVALLAVVVGSGQAIAASKFANLKGNPGLRSASAIVMDADGNVIYGKDPYTVRPIASITKVMTGSLQSCICDVTSTNTLLAVCLIRVDIESSMSLWTSCCCCCCCCCRRCCCCMSGPWVSSISSSLRQDSPPSSSPR